MYLYNFIETCLYVSYAAQLHRHERRRFGSGHAAGRKETRDEGTAGGRPLNALRSRLHALRLRLRDNDEVPRGSEERRWSSGGRLVPGTRGCRALSVTTFYKHVHVLKLLVMSILLFNHKVIEILCHLQI